MMTNYYSQVHASGAKIGDVIRFQYTERDGTKRVRTELLKEGLCRHIDSLARAQQRVFIGVWEPLTQQFKTLGVQL